MSERAFSCSGCGAVIVVVYTRQSRRDEQVAVALRRVDWQIEGNVVTCRTCVKKSLARAT